MHRTNVDGNPYVGLSPKVADNVLPGSRGPGFAQKVVIVRGDNITIQLVPSQPANTLATQMPPTLSFTRQWIFAFLAKMSFCMTFNLKKCLSFKLFTFVYNQV